jgi:hypothetical protein
MTKKKAGKKATTARPAATTMTAAARRKPATGKSAPKSPGKSARKSARKSAARGLATRKPAGPAAGAAFEATIPYEPLAAATIFLYKTADGHRIRTSPQILQARGYVEWTIVNLASDEPVDVEITWPNGGPWGKAPICIKDGNIRMNCGIARTGRYKYNVTANGYTEDPELEIPGN